ncbi:hypothetical protein HMPREF9711_00551 [Myroides odoratimimus CCUG 3837]|uniref:DUF892 family protein n=1 Tax=Myroides odoratimimus TaxID=76832 RepID=UPI000280A61F|nr:DUF892 family protein [Myroides odoratimimus]EKB07241.1 hypothetical protein HMPREF9711_00551 [Myroides odoratimimus CCUG 3837]
MKKSNNISKGASEFKDLFIHLLKGIYNTEHGILDSLPTMIEKATTHELKDTLKDHEIVTQRQIIRLEKIFRTLGITSEKESCLVMKTFDEVTQKIVKITKDGSMVRDAGLIVIAQQIEHYEIATYGGLIQFALAIEEYDIADLLEQTLDEEEQADCELTHIGECHINIEASDQNVEDEDVKESISKSSSANQTKKSSQPKDKVK